MAAWHVATDEDESHIVNDPFGDDEEDDEEEEQPLDDDREHRHQSTNGHDHHGDENATSLTTNKREHQHQQSSPSSSGHQLSEKEKLKQHASSSGGNTGSGASGAAANAASNSEAQRAKKREEARLKRQEDEKLLLQKKVRSTDKATSQLLSTIGPHPAPRLVARMLRPGQTVPSRRQLSQRQPVHAQSSSSSTDEEERAAILQLKKEQQQQQPPKKNDDDARSHDDADPFRKLEKLLTQMSLDSLKKVSESAKVKLPRNTQECAASEIARAAIRCGCERACQLWEKAKLLDKIAQHLHLARTAVLPQMAAQHIAGFFSSLSPDMLRAAAPALGVPGDERSATVPELWERVLATGLVAVLSNMRPRPLKKVAQELHVADFNDSASTEKQCDQVVYHIFPRERLRNYAAKKLRRAPTVSFSLVPDRVRCVGDMGLLTFKLSGLSVMRADPGERHYAPEFEFAGLKWSLLCMANRDSLALYLCQTSSISCKFVLSVVNAVNPQDESIFNEGTQKFDSNSSENDWGFNNVVSFDKLLDDKAGFLCAPDSVLVDVGIVPVASISPPPAAAPSPTAAAAAAAAALAANATGAAKRGDDTSNIAKEKSQQQQLQPEKDKAAAVSAAAKKSATAQEAARNDARGREELDIATGKVFDEMLLAEEQQQAQFRNQNNKGGSVGGGKANNGSGGNNSGSGGATGKPAVVDKKSAAALAAQLAEQERQEQLRRRIKQDLAKTLKDEARVRSDFCARSLRDLQGMADQCKRDAEQCAKDAEMRERQRVMERAKEQERLRQMQEQSIELTRRMHELRATSDTHSQQQQKLAAETAELRATADSNREQLVVTDAAVVAAREALASLREKLAQRKKKLHQLQVAVNALPEVRPETDESLAADSEIMRSVQQSLAGIIDLE